MDLFNLLAFLFCSTVLGLSAVVAWNVHDDIWEAWRSPSKKDKTGYTVLGNALVVTVSMVLAVVFFRLGREAWSGFSGTAAVSQLAALVVGTIGFSLTTLAILGGVVSTRDAYLARHSSNGRSPDGNTEKQNLAGLLGSVLLALVLPTLTTVLVKVCLW